MNLNNLCERERLILLKDYQLPDDILRNKKFLFDIEIDEDKNIKFTNIHHSLRNKLNYDGVYENSSMEDLLIVESSTLLYNGSSTVRRATNISKNLESSKKIDWDDENDVLDQNAALICMIALAQENYLYGLITDLSELDKKIPYFSFINIVNRLVDENKTIKVMGKLPHGAEIAGTIRKIYIEKSFMGLNVFAKIEIISYRDDKIYFGHEYINLPLVESCQHLSELGLETVEGELLERLEARGAKYLKYTKSHSEYVECSGFGYYDAGRLGKLRQTVEGRIMIDPTSMRYLNPKLDDESYIGDIFNSNSEAIINETEINKELWRMSPVVYGFAFDSKQWLEFSIDDISDIKFNNNAYSNLMIDEEIKDVFVSSLQTEIPSFDEIQNKGEGKIFLLYGPPGVGKTLTAESVSEQLQRPLYFVSVGELGTTPDKLERNLQDVMRIATRWNAVVLLDEVDVFAVKRKGASIERNAMTAIFLRALERYSGVMFMTTNLKNNLDDAFISRSTAVIQYKDLSYKTKKAIWTSVLEKAYKTRNVSIKLSALDMHRLSMKKLNGRGIKNIVRLAYSLAYNSEYVIDYKTIVKALKLKK